MLTKKEIIFYAIFVSIFVTSLIGGITLSHQAHLNINEFPYSGIVLNTECGIGWSWSKGYYNRDISFIIAYVIDQKKYIEVFELDYFSECSTTSSWEKNMNNCCEHMIGDKIWLSVSQNNITKINEISVTSGSSSTTHISFAIIFFVFCLGSGFILGKVGYEHWKNGYIYIPFAQKIPLIGDEFDDNKL